MCHETKKIIILRLSDPFLKEIVLTYISINISKLIAVLKICNTHLLYRFREIIRRDSDVFIIMVDPDSFGRTLNWLRNIGITSLFQYCIINLRNPRFGDCCYRHPSRSITGLLYFDIINLFLDNRDKYFSSNVKESSLYEKNHSCLIDVILSGSRAHPS